MGAKKSWSILRSLFYDKERSTRSVDDPDGVVPHPRRTSHLGKLFRGLGHQQTVDPNGELSKPRSDGIVEGSESDPSSPRRTSFGNLFRGIGTQQTDDTDSVASKPSRSGPLKKIFRGPHDQAEEDIDCSDLMPLLLQLGLVVCAADADDCTLALRCFTNTEAMALRCLHRFLLPRLAYPGCSEPASPSGPQVASPGVIESVVSTYLTSSLTSRGGTQYFSSDSEQDEAGQGPKPPAVNVWGPEARCGPSGSIETKSPRGSVHGNDMRLAHRQMTAESSSSVTFVKNMLRSQGDKSNAMTTGDLQWTKDGCPCGDGANDSWVQQSQALFQKYAGMSQVTDHCPPVANGSAQIAARLLDGVLQDGSLMTYLLRGRDPRRAAGEQSRLNPSWHRAARVMSEETVNTAVLIDLALADSATAKSLPLFDGPLESDGLNGLEDSLLLGSSASVHVASVPSVSELHMIAEVSTNSAKSTPEINVEEIERELDPQLRWQARKKKRQRRKEASEKEGKVTYGVLLRGSRAASHPGSPAAAGDRRQPEESSEAAVATAVAVEAAAQLAVASPASSTQASSATSEAAAGLTEQELALQRWRARKEKKLSARNLSKKSTYGQVMRNEHEQALPAAKEDADPSVTLPGFVRSGSRNLDDGQAQQVQLEHQRLLRTQSRELTQNVHTLDSLPLPPQPPPALAPAEGMRRSWTGQSLQSQLSVGSQPSQR